MVTHGMGQQVRFETCAQIAEAFVRGNSKPAAVHADRVQLVTGGDLLACMRVVFPSTATAPETHVDIFEGYWAPLTEGKISFTATIVFLFGTLFRGLKACLFKPAGSSRRVFTRWVFGEMREFPIKKRTFTHLIWTGAILALTLVIAYACEQVLVHTWYAVKTLLDVQRPAHPGFWAWFQPYIDVMHRLLAKFRQHLVPNILRIIGLVLAGIYAYWLRYAVVEYVGDVVIYVSSFRVSAYQEIRDAIQKTVVDVGKQIVAASLPPAPLDGPYAQNARARYDGLIFVGHSLGSVIAYDLINALIVWDATGCQGRHQVAARIRRFITFGSPLDKTAFLFRTQMREEHDYREALAGLMQPLILNYGSFRAFPWINLHSHSDPVSGSLAYYDLPEGARDAGPCHYIQNELDPAARIPLVAHVQYWNGKCLTDQLLAGL